MESDNSTSEVPKSQSPPPVDTQSATQQSHSPEAGLEKTPTPDTSAVASKPATPVPEVLRPEPAVAIAAASPNQ